MPGLAGLHVGSVDLGLGTDWSVPAFADALRAIVAVGRAAGFPVVMHAVSGERAQAKLDLGFDKFVLAANIELLRTAFARRIAGSRAEIYR